MCITRKSIRGDIERAWGWWSPSFPPNYSIQDTVQQWSVVSAAIPGALTMVTGLPHEVGSLVGRNRGTQDCRDLWEKTRVHFRLRITLIQNRWSELKKRYKKRKHWKQVLLVNLQ